MKGWVDSAGETFEVVYDVACSGGASVDPDTHRCPDNGARVDLSDCGISRDVGAAQLQTLWRDPAFDPGQRAFYYARVLENPTCRWSTWDALRAGRFTPFRSPEDDPGTGLVFADPLPAERLADRTPLSPRGDLRPTRASCGSTALLP